MPQEDIFAAMVVVLVFVFLMAFLWLAARYQRRDRELLHAERIAALEKGIPIPPELLPSSAGPPRHSLPGDGALQEAFKRLPGNSLKTGLVILCLGIGVTLAGLLAQPEGGHWVWGIVLMLAGVGYLVYWVGGGRDEWKRGKVFEEEARRRLLGEHPSEGTREEVPDTFEP